MKNRSTFVFGIRQALRYLLASFFSFLLIASLSFFILSFWAQLVLLICSLSITVMLIYQNAWEQGNHDSNYVARGMMEADVNRGFIAGVIAIIIPMILYILGLLAKVGVLPEIFFRLQNMLHPPLYALIGWLFCSVKEFAVEGGELTTEAWVMCSADEASWLGFVIQPLPLLALPFVSWLGYKLGRERILITDRILYKSPEDRAEKEHKRIEKNNRRMY